MEDTNRADGTDSEERIELPEEDEAAMKAALLERSELDSLNDKYLRLYADFDNYRKRVQKDKDELTKFANESLMYELLPAIDNLDLALKHASSDRSDGLVQGVEITLKELQRTLEKFGLTRIEAAGKPFDPAVHHAMSQVERDDLESGMVAEEFRPGYRYRDKVLRPALVAVSTRACSPAQPQADTSHTDTTQDTEEEK